MTLFVCSASFTLRISVYLSQAVLDAFVSKGSMLLPSDLYSTVTSTSSEKRLMAP